MDICVSFVKPTKPESSTLVNDQHEASEIGTLTRLPALIRASKGTAWLSGETGISRRMIDRYKAGAEPTLSNAIRIARALNVPLNALASEGSFLDVNVGVIHGSAEARSSLHQVMAETLMTQSMIYEDACMIPRRNVMLSAGLGIVNHDDDVDDEVPVSRRLLTELGIQPEKAHFIKAAGDSMEETIADGDDVLINMGDTALRSEGIYAVQVGELAMIKRVQPFAMLDTVTLLSDNPRYPSTTIKRGEQDQFRVIGRAKLVMRIL